MRVQRICLPHGLTLAIYMNQIAATSFEARSDVVNRGDWASRFS